jgi:hypothetical protein
LIHERGEPAGLILGPVGVAGRLVGQTEAGQIERDTAVALAQPHDQMSPDERPRRQPVDEEHQRAVALVDVVHARAVDLDQARDERIGVRIQPCGPHARSP